MILARAAFWQGRDCDFYGYINQSQPVEALDTIRIHLDKDRLSFDGATADLQYWIYQADGRLLLSGSLRNGNTVDLSQLPASSYIVSYAYENRNVKSQKILVK